MLFFETEIVPFYSPVDSFNFSATTKCHKFYISTAFFWGTLCFPTSKNEEVVNFALFSMCIGGYFLPKQEVTGSWTWWSFAALKTTTDECPYASISWKMPSKRRIFHLKKCPNFVDSVFKKIRARPAERAFLASVAGLFWQLWEPATKSLCAGSPFFEAQNRSEKSSSGPGGSKKGRIQNFFCLIL